MIDVDAIIAHFHEKADETNDQRDHDELHAAGAIVEHSAYGVGDERNANYIARWIEQLAITTGYEGEV